MEIPSIIHQSWKDDDIPESIYPMAWRQSWKTAHPEWEHMFWNNGDNRALIETKYPQFLDFYDSLDMGIKQADFSRFLYMHAYGGVYVDLDFICLREITPLLFGATIVVGQLSEENPYYRIPNAFMASAPHHDFWLNVAEDAVSAPEHERGVEYLCGPFRLQWALEKYRPRGLRVLEQHLIYPIDWIHLTDWDDGIYYRKDEAQLAGSLRNLTIEHARAAIPQAFAVTTWNHNW